MKDCTILDTYRQATSTFLSLVLFFLSWAIPQATAKTINQVPFAVGSVTADKFTRSYTTSTSQGTTCHGILRTSFNLPYGVDH